MTNDEEPENRRREARHRQHKRYYGKTAFMYRPRQWSRAEDELVLRHDVPDSELSLTIRRSMKSISNRRWRLRKEGLEKLPTEQGKDV